MLGFESLDLITELITNRSTIVNNIINMVNKINQNKIIEIKTIIINKKNISFIYIYSLII